MHTKRINALNTLMILFVFIAGCAPAKGEEQTKIDRIRITYSTWDRKSSIIIGCDSDTIQQGIITPEDSSITDKAIVSPRAIKYIANYIYKNAVDSVSAEKLDGSDYLVKVTVHSEIDTLNFYVQYKRSNNFLEKLTNRIKVSPYNEECSSIIHLLEIYNRLDKEGQP